MPQNISAFWPSCLYYTKDASKSPYRENWLLYLPLAYQPTNHYKIYNLQPSDDIWLHLLKDQVALANTWMALGKHSQSLNYQHRTVEQQIAKAMFIPQENLLQNKPHNL